MTDELDIESARLIAKLKQNPDKYVEAQVYALISADESRSLLLRAAAEARLNQIIWELDDGLHVPNNEPEFCYVRGAKVRVKK